MRKVTTEKESKIWTFIHKKQPVGVNRIQSETGISKPTVIKILRHFKALGEINYPSQKRGQQSLITLKKTEFKKIFSTVKKQANYFRDNYNLPVIVETKNYEIFAGMIDEYEARTLILYNAHELQTNQWNLVEGENEINWLELYLPDIEKIYTIHPEVLDFEEISLIDMMQLWQDLTHKIIRGIRCDWSQRDSVSHSKECEGHIHESIANIYKHIVFDSNLKEKEKSKLKESVEDVIESFVKKGAKIPWRSY